MVSAGLLACASSSSPKEEGEAPTGEAARCDPAKLGLAGAKRLPTYRAPEGCTRAASGPARVRSEQEFREAGAQYCLRSVADLPTLIDQLESK